MDYLLINQHYLLNRITSIAFRLFVTIRVILFITVEQEANMDKRKTFLTFEK